MHYLKTEYQDAAYRAEYYIWMALRNQPIAGNDPITGAPRGGRVMSVFRDEGRAAYKAMARYWLARARTIRTAFPK